MSGRPAARRGPESADASAPAKTLASRRSERRRGARCGFTEVLLLTLAGVFAGALFRLVPHASSATMANELRPPSQGGGTTASAGSAWAASPSQSALLDGLSDAQLAELVTTQNGTLAKLMQVVQALQAVGPAGTALPAVAPLSDARHMAVAASAAAVAAAFIAGDRSRERAPTSSRGRVGGGAPKPEPAPLRPPRGPPRPGAVESAGSGIAGLSGPRVVHGINLVPPTHGLHADQVGVRVRRWEIGRWAETRLRVMATAHTTAVRVSPLCTHSC
jgi:hypothetical protein